MFNKLKTGGMDLSHLAKGAKEMKKLEELNEDQYQMAMQLADWEIENQIRVDPVLRKPHDDQSLSFIATRKFVRMTPEETNEYKRIINIEKHEHDKEKKVREEGRSQGGETKEDNPQS